MTARKIKDGQAPVDFKELLGRVGWSGRELARRMDCGPSAVYKWLRNNRPPGSVIFALDLILRVREHRRLLEDVDE